MSEEHTRSQGPAIPMNQTGAGRSVVLSTGEEAWLEPGWNQLDSGIRAYLRRDGSVSESLPSSGWTVAGSDGYAEGAGGRAQDPGPAGQFPLVSSQLATKHGAWSGRRVDPLVESLVEVAVGAVHWLAEPSFQPALQAWARAEVRAQLISEWLDQVGPLDERGEPRAALAAVTQQESLALKHRTRLGLDPASRAQLEATLTSARLGQASLEAALERGAQALEARRASTVSAEAPPGSPNPTGGETLASGLPASPGAPVGARVGEAGP